jgi:hypothetical protein
VNRSTATFSTRSAPGSSWRPRLRLGHCIAALALLPVTPASAPPAAPEDYEVVEAGTFTLYLKGVRIGEERFVIRQELDGSGGPVFRAGAELSLKLDGRTQRIGVDWRRRAPKAALAVTRRRSTAVRRPRSLGLWCAIACGWMSDLRRVLR